MTTPLTILFIALKLTDNLDWGWEWVLAPIWIEVAAWLAFLLAGAVGLSLLEKKK